jgi:hypothetical protein
VDRKLHDVATASETASKVDATEMLVGWDVAALVIAQMIGLGLSLDFSCMGMDREGIVLFLLADYDDDDDDDDDVEDYCAVVLYWVDWPTLWGTYEYSLWRTGEFLVLKHQPWALAGRAGLGQAGRASLTISVVMLVLAGNVPTSRGVNVFRNVLRAAFVEDAFLLRLTWIE